MPILLLNFPALSRCAIWWWKVKAKTLLSRAGVAESDCYLAGTLASLAEYISIASLLDKGNLTKYGRTPLLPECHLLAAFLTSCKTLNIKTSKTRYSNTSQTRGSKLARFSNSRFLLLFFTSKLAVPFISTQIRDSCFFLSPKNREFGGITVHFT